MALKVYDLQCEHGHVFEGWFGSDDNYESQRERGLLSCPVCDSREVNKKLSAPRLNVSHIRAVQESGQGEASVAAPGAAQMAQLQAEVMRHIRQMVRNTENVGDRFVQEARRMHEGEIEEHRNAKSCSRRALPSCLFLIFSTTKGCSRLDAKHPKRLD
jgi:hypothetical protein